MSAGGAMASDPEDGDGKEEPFPHTVTHLSSSAATLCAFHTVCVQGAVSNARNRDGVILRLVCKSCLVL